MEKDVFTLHASLLPGALRNKLRLWSLGGIEWIDMGRAVHGMNQ